MFYKNLTKNVTSLKRKKIEMDFNKKHRFKMFIFRKSSKKEKDSRNSKTVQYNYHKSKIKEIKDPIITKETSQQIREAALKSINSHLSCLHKNRNIISPISPSQFSQFLQSSNKINQEKHLGRCHKSFSTKLHKTYVLK